MIEVFAEGKTYDDMFKLTMNKKRLKEEMDSTDTFGFWIYSHMKVYPEKEKVQIIEKFPDPWLGKLDLKKANRWFYVMEDWQWLDKNGSEKELLRIYFGKQLIDVHKFHPKKGPWCTKYELSDRIYIGPTSTTPELAFYMANQGLVTKDSVVMDPFVGTGSILVSVAHFRPFC